MLTGESVPVSKIPATDRTLLSLDLSASTMLPEVAKNFLFCGTKIVRARRPQESRDGEAVALAMVVRTGFNTTKGALVRSMLFPKPSGFKFYRDSFRYISVMACVALVGFTASLVNFIRLKLEWHLIIIRALDLITIVVPPALPATLTIGTTFALRRLKAKQIFCISPQRVNVGGKLDLMCFDKTGTLTEEGLDILGVRVVSRAENRFTGLLTGPHDLVSDHSTTPGGMDSTDTRTAALYTMATCHSLRIVDNEPVGDPLDLKMFEFTGWSYDEGNMGGANADEEEQGNLQPAVARPPTGPKHQTNGVGRGSNQNVSSIALQLLCPWPLISGRFLLSSAFSTLLSSSLNCGGPASSSGPLAVRAEMSMSREHRRACGTSADRKHVSIRFVTCQQKWS
jgi:cation-transporting ATPase 13A3/4/5